MNIIHRVLQATAIVGLFIAGSMGAYAQFGSLELEIHDTVKTVAPEGDYNFEVYAKNVSGADLTLTVIRTEAEYPNTVEWYSSICNGALCYPPDASETEPITLAAGEIAEIKLYMKAGAQPNTSGRAKLVFNAGLGGSQTVGFMLSVGSPSSSVPAMSQIAGSALYPNPTTGRLRFEYSLPTSGDVAISISSMTGQQLLLPVSEFQAAGSHSLDLDLSTLAVGAYVVTLNSRNTRGAQIVTVTR
jgi:hypothetical protein